MPNGFSRRVIEQKNKIEHEKKLFKKHVEKFSVKEIKGFKKMMAGLKEEFQRHRDEAKGAPECLKKYAEKTVQAHNEGLKRKALGHPAIDPKLIKKKKKPVTPAVEPSREDAPKIIFPPNFSGPKPPAPSIASERKKTQQAIAEARKCKQSEASAASPSQKRQKKKGSCTTILLLVFSKAGEQ